MIMNISIEDFVECHVKLNVSELISRIEEDDVTWILLGTSEQWVVSEWLGKRLKEKGEVVESFAGHTIWGRDTSGQRIVMDKVIQIIYMEN
jgi:hypothetical protein